MMTVALLCTGVGLRGQTFIDDDVYVCDCVDVCDEYCQNRMTWHECNPDECRAVQCNNQALQRQECAQISLQHVRGGRMCHLCGAPALD